MGFVVDTFFKFYKENSLLTTTNFLLSCTFPIDDVLVPHLTGKIVSYSESRKDFATELILLVVILIVMQAIYTLTSWHDALLFPKLQNFVRHSMIQDIMETFSGSHKDLMIGEVISRLVKIPTTIIDTFELMKNYLLPYILSFAITAYMIIRIDPFMGIVILLLVIIVYLTIFISPYACMDATQKQEATLAQLDEEVEDVLSNLTTVYSSNQTRDELKRLRTFEKKYEVSFSETMGCIVRTRMFAIIILGCILVFFSYRSYTRIKSKKLEIGKFVQMFIIIIQWFATMGWLSGNIRDLVIYWGILNSFERIKLDHDAEGAIQKKPSHNLRAVAIKSRHSIIFNNVNYTINGRINPILINLSFSIEQFERIAIIGDIGSGKSTILKLIVGLINPTDGEILIDGTPIHSLPLHELRNKVAYVSQHPQLFNRTVLENITYGVKNVDTKALIDMINELNVADAFDNLGNGLNSMVGKNGSRLSGGQRQMVACIRTLLMNPDIIVMDEVTASIDRKTKHKLFKVFEKMLEKKTVLMVTHDPDLMRFATRTIQIDQGRISIK